MFKDKKVVCHFSSLPKQGLPKEKILSILDERIAADIDPTKGKTFAYVYEHSK